MDDTMNSTMGGVEDELTTTPMEHQEEDVSSWSFANIFYAGILYHSIPGLAMIVGGLGYLLISLVRARALRPGQSFCASHIPEKNYPALKSISVTLLVLIVFLTARQVTGPCFANNGADASFWCWVNQPGHVAMYGSYASVCLVAILEAAGRVPADAWRCAAVLCCLLNYFLMAGHALMKKTPEDVLTHQIWGDIELYHAVIVSYSIYNTNNLPSYLASWMTLMVKGVWIFLAGYQLQFPILTMESIRPAFVLLVLLVTGVTTLIGAYFGNIHYESELERRNRPATEDYSQLLKATDADDTVGEGSFEDESAI